MEPFFQTIEDMLLYYQNCIDHYTLILVYRLGLHSRVITLHQVYKPSIEL